MKEKVERTGENCRLKKERLDINVEITDKSVDSSELNVEELKNNRNSG